MIAAALTLLLAQAAPEIQTYTGTWHDKKQDRDIPIRVTYPSTGTNLPSIVFSHGFRGAETTNDPLVTEWARHGYVVFQARHEDSIANLKGIEKLRAFNTKRDPNAFKAWRSRLADERFIYEVIGNVGPYVPELKGRLNPENFAQAGHSFGAFTSEVLGGATLAGVSFADARPKAFCLLSPQGANGKGLNTNSWKDFTRPMVVISGTEDRSPLDDERTQADPTTRQDPYKLSPAGDKYLLWMDGANHNLGGISGSFNWPGAGSPNPDMVGLVKATTLAFFDAYLKQDESAKRSLVTMSLLKKANVKASLTHR